MFYSDFLLLQAGFANKRRYEQRIVRRAVARLLEPYAAKGQSIDEFRIWPVPGDAEIKRENSLFVSKKNLELLKKFKEAEENQKKEDN